MGTNRNNYFLIHFIQNRTYFHPFVSNFKHFIEHENLTQIYY